LRNKLFCCCSVFLLLLAAMSAINKVNILQQIKDNTIRFHIIANSDSEVDQNTKLTLRDFVLQRTKDWFLSCTTKQQAVSVLKNREDELRQIADDFAAQYALKDSIDITITSEYFPTRQYGQYVMPAGTYDAVKIIVGSGQGKNWWCILFPQMCVTAAADMDLCTYYGESGVKIISDDDITFSFAILEWLGQLCDLFAGE